MTLDGFTAGVNQSFEKPFGDNVDSGLLDRWMFAEPEKHKHKREISDKAGITMANRFSTLEAIYNVLDYQTGDIVEYKK